ncbi:MAG: hypothetical protein LUF78_10830 [Clostridiales bacterium]|nr:hypothetical protein [Clostridiales bacterium]
MATVQQIIDYAVDWAVSIANDNSHGYSQATRSLYEISNPKSFDCSSLVLTAYYAAFIKYGLTPTPKDCGCSYTGNMMNLLNCGFEVVATGQTAHASMKKGDIELNTSYHTAMAIDGDNIVHARSSEGTSNTTDDSGNEIRTQAWYNYSHGWNYRLRFTGKGMDLSDSSDESDTTYLNGIDISNYQSGIDLSSVSADFVIIKATEGTTYTSPSFATQYKSALAAGKLVGVYHYSDGGDVESEADYFLKVAKDCIGTAILCLDWESVGNSQFNKNDKSWVKSWCDYVYAKTGIKPFVYTSAGYMSNISGIGYPLWIAQYANNNETGYQANPWNEGAYECVIRQYSSHGKLSGYSGYLDLDKFYGDKAAWKNYAGASSDSTASTTTSTTTTGGVYTFTTETVQNGSSGLSVLLLQEILKARGFKGADGKELELDRSAGTNTIYALTAYQQSRSSVLTVDGVCGAKTWADLIAL